MKTDLLLGIIESILFGLILYFILKNAQLRDKIIKNIIMTQSWKYKGNIITRSNDELVAEVFGTDASSSFANGMLIAAAPDLLEALLKLKEAIDAAAFQNYVHAIETDEVNMINAAISKAVGS